MDLYFSVVKLRYVFLVFVLGCFRFGGYRICRLFFVQRCCFYFLSCFLVSLSCRGYQDIIFQVYFQGFFRFFLQLLRRFSISFGVFIFDFSIFLLVFGVVCFVMLLFFMSGFKGFLINYLRMCVLLTCLYFKGRALLWE